MAKGKGAKRRVLPDHKQVGKKLIPPMMQFEQMQTFSYVDSLLPNLIWLSALFLRSEDRVAVERSVEFLRMCQNVLAREDAPPLAHFQNFNKLSDDDRSAIRKEAEKLGFCDFLCGLLRHQHLLLSNYPLSFLFESEVKVQDRDPDIDLLTEDVAALLDRYSDHSTKVQTTAFVGMMATGKLQVSRSIEMPDFNSIFTAPGSAAAKRVGSFVRASTNAGMGMREEGAADDWARQFWDQAYGLRECS